MVRNENRKDLLELTSGEKKLFEAIREELLSQGGSKGENNIVDISYPVTARANFSFKCLVTKETVPMGKDGCVLIFSKFLYTCDEDRRRYAHEIFDERWNCLAGFMDKSAFLTFLEDGLSHYVLSNGNRLVDSRDYGLCYCVTCGGKVYRSSGIIVNFQICDECRRKKVSFLNVLDRYCRTCGKSFKVEKKNNRLLNCQEHRSSSKKSHKETST